MTDPTPSRGVSADLLKVLGEEADRYRNRHKLPEAPLVVPIGTARSILRAYDLTPQWIGMAPTTRRSRILPLFPRGRERLRRQWRPSDYCVEWDDFVRGVEAS